MPPCPRAAAAACRKSFQVLLPPRPNYPSGCFVATRDEGTDVYFNNHDTGTVSEYFAPLCDSGAHARSEPVFVRSLMYYIPSG